MGTFTELGEHDFTELAAAFGLPPITHHRAIDAGTINSNFEIVAGGTRYFLRVNEGKSEDDVAYEAQLVDAFAAGGVPTPAPLVARDGRRYAPIASPARPASISVAAGEMPPIRFAPTKWVSIFPWRSGRHVAAAEVTPAIARSLGAALAQLHGVGLARPESWRRASIYDHAHLVERFHNFERSTDPALAHAIAILREELAYAETNAVTRRAATRGIIHGDLFRDNVLWEGEDIVAILDFEQASGGSLAYDLAVCVNDWCWTGTPRIDLAAALLEGYRSVRSLPAVDGAALVIEVRASAARFTITRITDVYLASVPNPDKDFRAFLARVEAWRGPALGQLIALL